MQLTSVELSRAWPLISLFLVLWLRERERESNKMDKSPNIYDQLIIASV